MANILRDIVAISYLKVGIVVISISRLQLRLLQQRALKLRVRENVQASIRLSVHPPSVTSSVLLSIPEMMEATASTYSMKIRKRITARLIFES